jgi:hypothetical protein
LKCYVYLRENLGSMRRKRAAGIGELHTNAVAVEQSHTEFILQVADLPTESGLGDPQLFRGTAEIQRLDHCAKITQMA